MSIYPLSYPPVQARSEFLRIVNNQAMMSSQFTGAQTVIQNYAAWTLDLDWPRMTPATAYAMVAWLDQLQGSLGTFLYKPFKGIWPINGSLSLSATAYATSATFTIKGFSANAQTGLNVGQYISIGNQLLRLSTVAGTADGSGNAVVGFSPPLRGDFPAGTAIETTIPRGVFRLNTDQSSSNKGGSGYQLDPDQMPEFSAISAVEAIGQ